MELNWTIDAVEFVTKVVTTPAAIIESSWLFIIVVTIKKPLIQVSHATMIEIKESIEFVVKEVNFVKLVLAGRLSWGNFKEAFD